MDINDLRRAETSHEVALEICKRFWEDNSRLKEVVEKLQSEWKRNWEADVGYFLMAHDYDRYCDIRAKLEAIELALKEEF